MGVGVFGKAQRTTNGGNSQGIGVFGKSTGSYINWGGVFWGDTGIQTVGKQIGDDNTDQGVSFGIWSSSGKNGTAAYFNGKTYSNEYFQAADVKLQHEIKPLTNAIEKLNLLLPTSFVFKTDDFKALNLPEGNQIGLNAQNLQEVFPELVKSFTDVSPILLEVNDKKTKDYKAINYTNLIPLLIAGMQEQQKQLGDQAKTNEDLKNLVAMQQQQMEDLIAKSPNQTGVGALNSQMDGFSMEQNIPNPFSNATVIKYNLPQSIAKAYMAVYDLSGKQITSFPLNQKGASSVTLSSEKLAGGIYIYSIIADGKVMDSKRMVVAE